ncbi:MAG: IS3 family transposase [Verrucomicrobiota bacterium]
MMIEEGIGNKSQACRALGLPRASAYWNGKISESSRLLHIGIVDLSREHPRYGYRRITALLRREGWKVNEKRVQRIRRKLGLQVSRKQRKMRRRGTSTAERQSARYANHIWSWDFVHDQTENGGRFRILTIIDEFTREWLAYYLDYSIRAEDVITILTKTMEKYGVPEHIRSDNGPEFIAYAVQDWLGQKAIKTLYIKLGSPWENGHIESFHGKIGDECLKREIFGNRLEAKVVIGDYRCQYNHQRPHSSLGYKTPVEFAADVETPLRPTAFAPSQRINKKDKQTAELYF